MAITNYSHSYTSNLTRAFQTTYHGTLSRTLKKFYTGGYEREYAGTYTGYYSGTYSKNYGKVWSAAYTGYYTGHFAASYTKLYEGTYTGQYLGTFEGYYTDSYDGYYTGYYDGTYEGYYDKNYSHAFIGYYSHAWTNATAYARNYEGEYVGNYVHGPWDGVYTKQFAGDRTYAGQYTGNYSHAYSHAWNKVFVISYTGQYVGTYSGWYNTAYWTGVYMSYDQAPFNYLHASVTYGSAQFSKSYSAQYANQFAGTDQYTGYFNVSDSYTGYYTALAWTGAQNYHGGAGEAGQQWSGVATWIQSTGNAYVKAYERVVYLWDGEPVDVQFTTSYVANPSGTAWASQWSSLAYFSQNWSGSSTTTQYYAGSQPTYWVSGSIGGTYPNLQFWDFAVYVAATNYASTTATTGYFAGGAYLQSVARQWTGPAQWSGQRTHTSYANYEKAYTGNWDGSYEGTAYYVGYWTGVYSQSVEKFFDGLNYEHISTGSRYVDYIGYYEHAYEGQYGGSRTYAGQYEGEFIGYYGISYEGAFTGTYTGLAAYGTRVDGIGSFTGTYEGAFEKNFMKTYVGQWTGNYTHDWVGSYTHIWVGQYEGPRDHSFTRQREVNYAQVWDQIFVGYYGNTYGKVYVGYYTGNYSHDWIGYYTKLYGGSWLGNTTSTYVGAQGNYTKSYVGNPSYDQIYSGTTNYTGLKTGELQDKGIARIKQAGAWKEAKNVHVKKSGAWKESKAIYIKEGTNWILSHIGYERTDITLNSATDRFNLKAYLMNLSKAIAERPQLVNIIIDGCDVFSLNESSAALDLSGFGAINLGGNSIKHRVRVLVHPDARIIGTAGRPGAQEQQFRLGHSGTNGGPAIKTSPAIELFIENYGIIAGGGGGGGSGGYPVNNSGLQRVGGAGGYGAGYSYVGGTGVNILENNSLINGSNSAVAYGIHGGSGGLLGHRGTAAGGYDHDDASLSAANDGALKTQYDLSGSGGLPGAAITGYDATRTTFINTGNVWGDSKYKFQV